MRIVAGVIVIAYCAGWLLAKRFLMRGGWKILPLLIAVVAAGFTGNEVRWAVFESRLADAVRPVMGGGGQATFACERVLRGAWSSQGRVGHVWFNAAGHPEGDAFLSTETCARVKAWRGHPTAASLEEIVAVHTVTHESAHLSGIRDEASAECVAVQHDPAVMTALGATLLDANSQVRRYLAEVYPQLPDGYRSSGCVAGGDMDLTPTDGTWP